MQSVVPISTPIPLRVAEPAPVLLLLLAGGSSWLEHILRGDNLVQLFSSRARWARCHQRSGKSVGGYHTRISFARIFAAGSFWARAMYERSGGCPTMLDLVSRTKFVFHSQDVVSGWPVPTYFGLKSLELLLGTKLIGLAMTVSRVRSS